MNHKVISKALPIALCLLSSVAWAATLYVNGVTGSDINNNCTSPTTPCKTIGHAISAASAGNTIEVAASTYAENLSITFSLNIIGSGASTTVVDGGGASTVVTISSTSANVTLSAITIRNGSATKGGGIYNSGTLTLNRIIVTANHTTVIDGSTLGGGIYNGVGAVLTINKSSISGNTATAFDRFEYAYGGGIANNQGKLTINSSTINGNSAALGTVNGSGRAYGGGIANLLGTLVINNSTLSGNSAKSTLYTLSFGGGISNGDSQTISNTTISGNSAVYGGGISGSATLQNTIVANSPRGGNCSGTMTSKGYNLSSDESCNFSNTGDMNNANPMLDTLGNYGGPTQTIPLLPGSPAIDAGNPSGCTNSNGVLLKSDQRGFPRPNSGETGCDIGAFETQTVGGAT